MLRRCYGDRRLIVLQVEQLVAVVAAVEAVVAAVRFVCRIRGLLSLSGANLFLSHCQRPRYLSRGERK